MSPSLGRNTPAQFDLARLPSLDALPANVSRYPSSVITNFRLNAREQRCRIDVSGQGTCDATCQQERPPPVHRALPGSSSFMITLATRKMARLGRHNAMDPPATPTQALSLSNPPTTPALMPTFNALRLRRGARSASTRYIRNCHEHPANARRRGPIGDA